MGRSIRSATSSAFSYLALLWAILTAPLLIISTISDLVGIVGLVRRPVRAYRSNVSALLSALGVKPMWPQWATDVAIFALLIAFIGWVYLIRVKGEERRQLKAAREGRAILVHPQPLTADIVDTALGATGVGGVLVSGAVGHYMLASGAALAGTGPIGWVIAPFALAGLAFWASTKRDEQRKAAADRHAREETERIAREQQAIAIINIAHFNRTETRKLVFASAAILMLVTANFLAELF